MKTLLQLLIKYSTLLLFVVLEIVAVAMVVTNNAYQRSVFFSSCNAFAAGIYSMSSTIGDYFGLRTENERLAQANVALQERVNQLENQLQQYPIDSTKVYIEAERDRSYIPAKVVNIITNKQHNYLTINKGKRDGVLPDMGVMSAEGVVGIVCAASDKFALVIPVINTSLNISSKTATGRTIGTLQWGGEDIRYAQLNEIARHHTIAIGDTILTSGLSTIFPEDIPIGVVANDELTDHDTYHRIEVALTVDFSNINYVTVICNHNQEEQVALEQQIQGE